MFDRWGALRAGVSVFRLGLLPAVHLGAFHLVLALAFLEGGCGGGLCQRVNLLLPRHAWADTAVILNERVRTKHVQKGRNQ